MVLNNDVKMINQVLPFAYIWARILQKVPYGRDNQNQANVTYAKDYMLRTFPENLK